MDSGRHFVWERRKFKREKREREREKEQQTLYVFLASERGTKLFFSFLLQQVSLLIKATLFPSLPIHLPFSLSLSSSQWLMSCFQSSNRGEQVVDPFGLFGLEYRAIQTNLSLSLSLLLPFSSACCRLFFFYSGGRPSVGNVENHRNQKKTTRTSERENSIGRETWHYVVGNRKRTTQSLSRRRRRRHHRNEKI